MVYGYLIFVVVYLLFLFVEMGFLMSNLSLTYPNNWGSCFFVAAGLDLLSQDRYINHIINVTGASVVLRGKGLECSGTIVSDEQPFHLYLSSNNARSLEEARILAENLLSTVSAECGTSRMSCSGVYATVPPPQQLLAGTRSWNSATEVNRNMTPAINSSLVSAGTNYSGYGGIYPQATPLQQVALALRHAPAFHTIPTSHALTTTTPSQVTNLDEKIKLCSSEKDTRQRRKFKERAMVPVGTSPAYQVEHAF